MPTTEGRKPTPPDGRTSELATEIVPLAPRRTPPGVWRSATEVQSLRQFRRRTGLDFEAVAAQLIEAAEPRAGDLALDVATHAGLLARQLARRVGDSGHVIGVEATDEAVEQARLAALSTGHAQSVEWRTAEPDRLPFGDESFDIVTCANSFRRLPARQFMTEAYRVLKPGGRLLIAEQLRAPSIWIVTATLRGYDRLRRRHPEAAGEQYYLPEEIAEMLSEVGFSQSLLRGLQPRNRRGLAFTLVKAVK
jgi:ubiquinone/menaquinone biosynthesis C-methylase UbiE